jgi:hypothetical protein
VALFALPVTACPMVAPTPARTTPRAAPGTAHHAARAGRMRGRAVGPPVWTGLLWTGPVRTGPVRTGPASASGPAPCPSPPSHLARPPAGPGGLVGHAPGTDCACPARLFSAILRRYCLGPSFGTAGGLLVVRRAAGAAKPSSSTLEKYAVGCLADAYQLDRRAMWARASWPRTGWAAAPLALRVYPGPTRRL